MFWHYINSLYFPFASLKLDLIGPKILNGLREKIENDLKAKVVEVEQNDEQEKEIEIDQEHQK